MGGIGKIQSWSTSRVGSSPKQMVKWVEWKILRKLNLLIAAILHKSRLISQHFAAEFLMVLYHNYS